MSDNLALVRKKGFPELRWVASLRMSILEAEEYEEATVGLVATILAISKHCVCPICHIFLIDPTCLRCGHIYCTFCLQQWFRHNWCCPQCDSSNFCQPITKRIWSLDEFITDFHKSIYKYVGESLWENTLPIMHYDLNWSLSSLEERLNTYRLGTAKPTLMTPLEREELRKRRISYLLSHPVNFWHHVGVPVPNPQIPQEFGISFDEPNYTFWIWIGSTFLIYMLLDADITIRLTILTISMTMAVRNWLHRSIDDTRGVPSLIDWFITTATAEDVNELELPPLNDCPKWEDILELLYN